MRRLTLRTRATLLATALTGLTLVLASVALVLTLEAHLRSGADELARSRIHDLLQLAATGDLPATLTNLDDEGVGQVVSADGRVLAASPNIRGAPPIAGFDPGPGLSVRTVDAPDDVETETYRLWAGTGPGRDGEVTVYLGTSLESVREASTALRRSLLVGVPVLLLLIALGTWLVIGRALARVDRIRLEVDAINEDRLDRRVPDTGVDDEVGRLAATMNRMLARLEASARRQRDLVADVSHDLQSPLAAQRAQVEVALEQPATTDVTTLGTGVLATTTEMERLVGDLLVLAAVDAGAPAARAAPLDLEDVVLEEAARARSGRDLVVDTSRVSAAPVLANRGEAQRIVRNLLDNAAAHARSRVELRVGAEGGHGRLDVLDDGPGVPDGDRERIFERFHSGDRARSRQVGGSGLGLAIARSLAERAGGRLTLADEDGERGAHFVLLLPGTSG
ncbi:ATP-binding protein [Nocardioides sp. MAHUQ-72]|uniref:sensor histidine kinase n=1 Tax=unclassified Nocardioides TaxID=2615069 RepID=UPI0036169E28